MEPKLKAILYCNAKEGPERETLAGVVSRLGGKIVKAAGPACISALESPEKALSAAFDYAKQYAARHPDQPALKAGLSWGQVMVSGADIFGEPVNLASRLEGIASSGEILTSESALHDIPSSKYEVAEVGTREFSGISAPVKVYRIKAVKTSDQPSASPLDPAAFQGNEFASTEFQNEAPASSKAEELFDFSRIDQERIQDVGALSTSGHSIMAEESSIPLRDEPVMEPEGRSEYARTPGPKRAKSRTGPSIEVRSKLVKNKKRSRLKWAALSALFFVLIVPTVLIGSWWGYFFLKTKMERPKVSEDQLLIQKKLEESDILRTMKKPRRSTNNRTVVKEYSPAEQNFGSILVRTVPDGANIWVDDKPLQSTTPVRVKQIQANLPIRIRVQKPGYRPESQFISLTPGEEKVLKFKLYKE